MAKYKFKGKSKKNNSITIFEALERFQKECSYFKVIKRMYLIFNTNKKNKGSNLYQLYIGESLDELSLYKNVLLPSNDELQNLHDLYPNLKLEIGGMHIG